MKKTGEIEFVTVHIGEQLFGLPIDRVHDVFAAERLTRVPMARGEIAGILNLRGRIVTAIDMRRCLDLPPKEDITNQMAVGIEFGGESYGLLIDEVGEVMKLPAAQQETVPVNLDARWRRVGAGVYRLEQDLMIILDIDSVLEVQPRDVAA
ncbi:MAG TPA: chemotaxis protein CheW [Xanthobacteraceae bacterium]|nr:chemotaxis protein CheW [Xanthobacteraceae bacterium]